MSNSAVFTSPPSGSGVVTPVGIPTNVFNELDEFGLLLGLQRLVRERNPEYKQRLMRVFSERANSTYVGLMNGITLGLGLEYYNAITITPLESVGVFIATNPAVIFSQAKLYLYSNVQTGVLDRTIDRYDKTGTAWRLVDLIARINESTYFSASLATGADQYSRSMCILNQKSHNQVTTELVPVSLRFELDHKNIIKGTLFFSDRLRFVTEVASEGAVTSEGKYFVDYKKGQVLAYTSPIPNSSVRYEYLSLPMTCKASPVIIHDMQHKDFKIKMFEQLLSDDGQTVNGLVSSLGADLVNELLSVFPGYWGE